MTNLVDGSVRIVKRRPLLAGYLLGVMIVEAVILLVSRLPGA